MDNNRLKGTKIQKARRQFTPRERVRHLSNWERSGVSATEYAKRNGLEERHLYAWRMQQRKREGKSASNALIPVRLTGTPAVPSSLSITLRHREIEYVVSGTGDTEKLVSVVGSLRREVLSV